MLDIKFIRENADKVTAALKDRGLNFDLAELLKNDARRRELTARLDELRAKKNAANQRITQALKEKKDLMPEIAAMKETAAQIDSLEKDAGEFEEKIAKIILTIPNIPHESIPRGAPSANKVVRTWGSQRAFDFKPLSHIELCAHLDLIDFARASKITGSNFILFKGQGARLERALYNFMLDLHTKEHGYTEIFPPFLVNRASMIGTGQLPKLEEDMYRLKDDDLFLIPTAEVPVTNIFRDDILDEGQLPVYYTAYTACFRREAGSYGKETRGLMRVHQFDKVELVKFVRPDTSYDELEKLVANAERVLQLLRLPYRVVMLATGDISFSAAKCYDLEAYAPGMDKWLEVSSCSNFESFQARRANIKYKPANRQTGKPATEYVHTLNGSGVALARTYAAILENYQRPDGSMEIPEVLVPYMGGSTLLATRKS
ncbi:MAG: serine--tRNA ligase [Candidatus Omnitrophota bacterium]|nr:serine--tRNA ligase [Candidatus Omnitrophota bacterium]